MIKAPPAEAVALVRGIRSQSRVCHNTSQEAWQRGEMIGWRQQVVGDQRVEEMLGRQTRRPKNVPQGGDDEARRKPSTEDQASHRDRKQLMGMSAQRLSTRAFGDGRVLLAIGHSRRIMTWERLGSPGDAPRRHGARRRHAAKGTAKAQRVLLVVCTKCAARCEHRNVHFYAVLSVRPHTVCNRNLDIRTGQGDLGS